MDDEITEPKLIVFLIPLPEPLGIPHGNTYMFDEGRDADIGVDLSGIPVHPTSETPAMPNISANSQFVSMRIWQVKSTLPGLREQTDALKKVLQALTGAGGPGTETDENTSSFESVLTVIEVATYLEPGAADPSGEAFDRSLARIQKIASAYSIATRQHIAPITIERLPTYALILTRTLEAPPTWSEPSLHFLHTNDVERSTPRELDAETTQTMSDIIRGQAQRHPIAPYLELAAESRRAFDREGDYRSAVIYLHTAGEVLLDSVLAALLWEAGRTPEEAARRFVERSLAGRLKSQYREHLKGNWSLEDKGKLATWYTTVSRLRNRCAHGGYQPTHEEVHAAQEAHDGLRQFVIERLVAAKARFPKAAALHTTAAQESPDLDMSSIVDEFTVWRDEVTEWRLKLRQ
jgi:hypothetical protein